MIVFSIGVSPQMKSGLRAAQVEGNPDEFVAGDEAKASEDH